MKKFIFLIITSYAITSAYSQSSRYGGVMSASSSIKSPDTDTSHYGIGFEAKVIGIYNPVSCMVSYDNFEKMLSVLIGVGHIGVTGQKNTIIMWGIGPQIDIINSSEYLTKHQKFLGAGIVFRADNPEKFELGIQTSFTVNSKKDNPNKDKDNKINLESDLVKKFTKHFGLGISGMYEHFGNVWHNEPLWSGRYFSYRKTLVRFSGFIQYNSKSVVFKVGPLFEQTKKDFGNIEGGYHDADTKPIWGVKIDAVFKF